MNPKERFVAFIGGIDNGFDLSQVLTPDVYQGVTSDQLSSSFSNQEKLSAALSRYVESDRQVAVETEAFRKILEAALDSGAKRSPREWTICVHLDWMLEYIEKPIVSQCMTAIAETLSTTDRPIFLTVEKNKVDIQTTSWKEALQFNPARAIPTITRPYLKGYLHVDGFEQFFHATEGYHPDDRYILHGGDANICLTDAGLQLMAMTMGHWWAYPGCASDLMIAKTIIAHAGDMTHIPVRFGHALDTQRNFSVFSASPVAHPAKYVARKFQYPDTQLYTASLRDF